MLETYVEVVPMTGLSKSANDSYTYRWPKAAELPERQLVKISFGRRTIVGVVVGSHHKKPPYAVKSVAKIMPERLLLQQVDLARAVARVQQVHLGKAVELCVPTRRAATPPVVAGVSGVHTGIFGKEQAAVMDAIDSCEGQVVVVVPERWQVEEWRHRLQANGISSVSWSGSLTRTQQRRLVDQISQGEARVVIGTRRSVFLPWCNLSLVVLADEWLGSYVYPRQFPWLPTSSLATLLAQQWDAGVLVTGAVPSLASFAASKRDDLAALFLEPPSLARSLFAIEYIQVGKQRRASIPRRLVTQLRDALQLGERVVFLYSTHKEGEKMSALLPKIFPRAAIWQARSGEMVPVVSGRRRHHGELLIGTTALFGALKRSEIDAAVVWKPEQLLFIPGYAQFDRVRTMLDRVSLMVRPRRTVKIVTGRTDALESLVAADRTTWLEREIKIRSSYHLPPAVPVTVFHYLGKTKKAVQKEIVERAGVLRSHLLGGEIVRGPVFWRDAKKRWHSTLVVSGDIAQVAEVAAAWSWDRVEIDPLQLSSGDG